MYITKFKKTIYSFLLDKIKEKYIVKQIEDLLPKCMYCHNIENYIIKSKFYWEYNGTEFQLIRCNHCKMERIYVKNA
jgi:hypothetical protein